uniref:TGF_BETA_2 domain-containing protein n=1 Tax=Caenorhabditis tropicalis TaxID=1561998 RepID=A0A1I7UIK6_9PELO
MRFSFELGLALLLILITQVRSSDLDYSSDLGNCPCEIEIYEADQPHGIIKSPNYPRFEGCEGRCIYKV